MLLSPSNGIAVQFHPIKLSDDFPMKSVERHPGTVNFNNLHFHSIVEIGVCLEGSGLLFMYNQILPFKKGDMAIVFADQPHVMVSSKEDPSYWRFIMADTDRLFTDIGITEYKPLAEILKYHRQGSGVITKDEHSDLHCLFFELLTELDQKNPEFQNIAKALLWAFLLKTARIRPYQETESEFLAGGNEFSLIVPALNHITNNFSKDINLGDLSALCLLSSTHFERVFRKVMGRTPISYLNEVRVRMASALLRSTDIPVIDISYDVGYRNVTSFYRYFKKYKNISPLEYRKRHLDVFSTR